MVLFGQGRKGIWHASVNAQGAERMARKWRRARRRTARGSFPTTITTSSRSRKAEAAIAGTARGLLSSRSAPGSARNSDHRQRCALPADRSPASMPSAAVCGRSDSIPTRSPTQGNAVPVLEGVSRATGSFTGAANFSISDNGTLAYVRAGPTRLRHDGHRHRRGPDRKDEAAEAEGSAGSIRVASRVSRRTPGGRRRGSRQRERP